MEKLNAKDAIPPWQDAKYRKEAFNILCVLSFASSAYFAFNRRCTEHIKAPGLNSSIIGPERDSRTVALLRSFLNGCYFLFPTFCLETKGGAKSSSRFNAHDALNP